MNAIGKAVLGPILLAAILAIAGCSHRGELRVSEGIGTPMQEGTLMLVEVITPLTRERALELFRAVDLEAAALKESDVTAGTAVFVSPWKQRSGKLSPSQGLYALVGPAAGSLDSGPSHCSLLGGCASYGGDAVAIRVLKRPPGGAGEPVLYVVERIIEPRRVTGDCYYDARGSRQALHCKSLDAVGWEWQGDVFVKRPGAMPK